MDLLSGKRKIAVAINHYKIILSLIKTKVWNILVRRVMVFLVFLFLFANTNFANTNENLASSVNFRNENVSRPLKILNLPPKVLSKVAIKPTDNLTTFTTTNASSNNRRASLMVFVSFSMPKKLLQNYFIESQKLHGRLILRGLVNQSFDDTMQKIHEIIQDARGGFDIDPIAFEKLNILRSPAIVLLSQNALDCLNQRDCTPVLSDYDVVYGNVSIDYALSLFAQNNKISNSTLRINKSGSD